MIFLVLLVWIGGDGCFVLVISLHALSGKHIWMDIDFELHSILCKLPNTVSLLMFGSIKMNLNVVFFMQGKTFYSKRKCMKPNYALKYELIILIAKATKWIYFISAWNGLDSLSYCWLVFLRLNSFGICLETFLYLWFVFC